MEDNTEKPNFHNTHLTGRYISDCVAEEGFYNCPKYHRDTEALKFIARSNDFILMKNGNGDYRIMTKSYYKRNQHFLDSCTIIDTGEPENNKTIENKETNLHFENSLLKYFIAGFALGIIITLILTYK